MMLTNIPVSFHESTERSGTTNRFENSKQQSMNLLQRVKEHLQYKSAKVVHKKQCIIDVNQLDQQVEKELSSQQNYDIMDDDINHQKLIDNCVRDILRKNNPVIEETDTSPIFRGSQRSSFSMVGKNIPKNRIKRLSSTILVGQMVKNKGLEKPTLHQIKQAQIDKMILFEREKKTTEITSSRPLKIILPAIFAKNQERESVTISQRLQTQKKRLFSQEPSPLQEHHTTMSMVSDSFEQSPKYNESHRRIETLINQINNEKDEITTHQRRIRNSIFLNQKNYKKMQPKEKYNYLKHEENIFGKVKKRKPIL